jgi:hypothetical protein
MTRQNWPAYSAVAGFFSVGLSCMVALLMQSPADVHEAASASAVTVGRIGEAGRSSPAPAAPATQAAMQGGPAVGLRRPDAPRPGSMAAAEDHRYYEQLRSRVRWVQTSVGGAKLLTPDLDSRLLLAKSAARRAGLSALGLGFEDVYGIITAETSWIPRMGASKDGTPNIGIAQFEPATAKALGMLDPQDPVEAVHAAALHMREAALWSTARIAGLKLAGAERAAKLREGISIYYNLSTRGRNEWNGRNTGKLPRETQLHIQNARIGAQQAEFFDAQSQAMQHVRANAPRMVTASTGQGAAAR